VLDGRLHYRRIAVRGGESGRGDRGGKGARCGILARVEASGYPQYDVAAYISALRREGELLAAAAERAGMDAAVPSCAGWQVRDLLKHTGYVHRWAARVITQRLTRPATEPGEEEILRLGPDDESLLGWFREGHAALVQALDAASADLDCWAFLGAPSPLAFWARRQAHETAIHRADAEQAAAIAGHATMAEPWFEPAFAADGVDELIMGFLGRNIRQGRWPGLGGTLGIHADDGDGERADWLVAGEPGAALVSRGRGLADCDVTGPACDLYLMLWNRRSAAGLKVAGDRDVLSAFSRGLRITWH
jgi:uncharacterized protein (TIGR03083 family)